MIFDEKMMRRCLELARIALANGDAPVGSLIISGEETLAEAVEAVKTKNDPTAHAEMEAVRAACQKLNTLDLSAGVLYTNVEPCWMCSYAIRQTGISRVVFGTTNLKIGGFTSHFSILTSENLKMPLPLIEAGVLHAECEALLVEFEPRKTSL